MVSPEDSVEAKRRPGVLHSQHKLDLVALLTPTAAAVTPLPGTSRTAFADYIVMTGQTPLSSSTFFERFSHPFGQLVREVMSRAVEAVREVAGKDKPFNELGVLLKEFTDGQAVYVTCQLLQRRAADWPCPPARQSRLPSHANSAAIENGASVRILWGAAAKPEADDTSTRALIPPILPELRQSHHLLLMNIPPLSAR